MDKDYQKSFQKKSKTSRPFGMASHKTASEPVLRRKRKFFKKKDLYIDSPNKKNRPAWLIPLLLVFGISLVVFWLGPLVLNTITQIFFHETETGTKQNLEYDSPDYAVVEKQVADLYETPDLKAVRKTQVLYNQLVHIIDRSTYGFYLVELDDGTQGYIMSDDVTSSTGSMEASLYEYKIIVISKSKRVMTHSSNGSTIMEAMMGTVLYSNYQGDGVYRVALPNSTEGWIGASGVLKIKMGEEIQKSNAKSFYTTVLSFNNTTYINKGLTANGASSEGIAYIAARINGIALPRDKEAQRVEGVEVPLQYDAETGLLLFENFETGDLVFFKSAVDPEKAGEMGIVVGYGQVLMSRNSKASMKILDLDADETLKKSVMTVRRIF
jgi:hypothetical protein